MPAKSVSDTLLIVLQLSGNAPVPVAGGSIDKLSEIEAAVGASVGSNSRVQALRPVIDADGQASLAAMAVVAVARTPSYIPADFSRFYYLLTEEGVKLDDLVRQARTWPFVERAYLEGAGHSPAEPPKLSFEDEAAFLSGDETVLASLKYLDPQPVGIDAKFAWTHKGQGASDITFIDIERGWDLTHPDLKDQPIERFNLIDNAAVASHGTSVLGIVVGADNGAVGATGASSYALGIAPYTGKIGVLGYNDELRHPQAIADSLGVLSFGDVLLIEIEVPVQLTSDTEYLVGPVDAYYLNYLLTQLATALGIIVVQAGGNGTHKQINGEWSSFAPALNMDTFETIEKDAPVAPLNRSFRDSGSILVSAARAELPHQRWFWAPHGKRVDCYAWGDGVYAPAKGSTSTAKFGGTSAASAIVAGAALATQSAAFYHFPWLLSPLKMRYLLSTFGTPEATGQAIGLMPDLAKVIERLDHIGLDMHLLDNHAPVSAVGLHFNIAGEPSWDPPQLVMPDHALAFVADSFVRDHVGDDGLPHKGSVSASPDIFVTSVETPEPFGSPSNSPSSASAGAQFVPAQDNYVYVRVSNRSQVVASGVTATIYAVPLDIALTASAWTPLGTTSLGDIAALGSTVTSAIVLPASMAASDLSIMILCALGSATAQAAKPPASWDLFTQLVQSHNDVAARLLIPQQQLTAGSAPAADAAAGSERYRWLPFALPGGRSRRLPMVLEVSSRLPDGARIRLEARTGRAQRRDQGRPPYFDTRLSISPNTRVQIGPLAVAPRSRNVMRLGLQLPEAANSLGARLWVRQLLDGRELGRLTCYA